MDTTTPPSNDPPDATPVPPPAPIPLAFDAIEEIGWTTSDDAAETGTPWE